MWQEEDNQGIVLTSPWADTCGRSMKGAMMGSRRRPLAMCELQGTVDSQRAVLVGGRGGRYDVLAREK